MENILNLDILEVQGSVYYILNHKILYKINEALDRGCTIAIYKRGYLDSNRRVISYVDIDKNIIRYDLFRLERKEPHTMLYVDALIDSSTYEMIMSKHVICVYKSLLFPDTFFTLQDGYFQAIDESCHFEFNKFKQYFTKTPFNYEDCCLRVSAKESKKSNRPIKGRIYRVVHDQRVQNVLNGLIPNSCGIRRQRRNYHSGYR